MAVIIDEFEVIPQREDDDRPPQRAPVSAPAPPTAAELERALRTLRERLDRVRAR
jgi:hypothetical protein